MYIIIHRLFFIFITAVSMFSCTLAKAQVSENKKSLAVNSSSSQPEIPPLLTYENVATIPDLNFVSYLKSKFGAAFTKDNKLMIYHPAVYLFRGIIDVTDRGITSLEGIQYFKSITELYCNSNLLGTIDVSNNLALKRLNCSYNRLSKLDVSRNINLEELYCSANQLSRIDVSRNLKLKILWCYYNKLISLDLSKNLSLTVLRCYSNHLTTLDISKNKSLTGLGCAYNKLKSLDISSQKRWDMFLLGVGDGSPPHNNPMAFLKVNVVQQQHIEIRQAKSNGSAKIEISTWQNDSNDESPICKDYNPNTLMCDK